MALQQTRCCEEIPLGTVLKRCSTQMSYQTRGTFAGSRYHNYLAPDAGRSAVLQYMYMYRTEPVPPFILTFQMRSISHVVACQVELALFHRALGVVFQEH